MQRLQSCLYRTWPKRYSGGQTVQLLKVHSLRCDSASSKTRFFSDFNETVSTRFLHVRHLGLFCLAQNGRARANGLLSYITAYKQQVCAPAVGQFTSKRALCTDKEDKMASMDERFAFIAEWYDANAALIRRYQFLFYTKDNTIEMFDIKNRRVFLKRSKCEGIELRDVFIGASVSIHSRQLKFVDYADDFTRKRLSTRKERTLAMVKPCSTDKVGHIIDMIFSDGLHITKAIMTKVSRAEAQEFYRMHEQKPFYDELVRYLTSGIVIPMELMGENAIQRWRQLAGPTDSAIARSEAPLSVRAKFGKDKQTNAVHGADSPENAERELNFFFAGAPKPNTATLVDCTCCVIKPHAVLAGHAGKIIVAIQEAGFTISALQMFNMDRANAEEFYEVYKGVVAEYTDMVTELISGPSIALEVTGKGGETPASFREFVGPADPEIARHLRPRTLRAIFGTDKIKNAVHCTDLPEDGVLETEYFFRILSQ
ncbi:nucleoside diphosphate kinase homolog 7-like isoform X2 [Ptychodera flava]|uniref:nucleoside diphosphate kinase homolog 7-like isoform X2 n=1 Tax=Ptychodera flava TaxID=63121 RepID=UPI00396AA2A3